jgi:HSP20 family protein
MDLIVREMEVTPEDMAKWAEEIAENPETYLFYYGIPEYPPVRITSKDDNIIIRAEAPGMDADDFNITVAGRNLRISGVKKIRHEEEQSCIYCMERPVGDFNRLIFIPADINHDKIKAVYKNGMLKITLARKEKEG